MLKVRSFQTGVFLAILAVAVAVAGVALLGATLLLREIVAGSGTAGPWEAVAESGRALIDSVQRVAPADRRVGSAIRAHQEALSESLRLSRLYALVGERFLRVLPLVALAAGVLMTALALVIARALAYSLSRPISELIGWTERIARSEPLPEAAERSGASVREFEALRGALRRMAAELDAARRRQVEAERLRAWTDMARRVAHELKNPLTPMRLALARIQGRADRALHEPVAVLGAEIERLDEMARAFSQFGRLPEGPTSQIDLVELMEALARSHASQQTRIVVHAPHGLPPVNGHYETLLRAFRNLLLNALDASAGESTGVEIWLRAIEANGDGEGAAPFVEVRVADRGPGLDPEIIDRIWEPGFTTKSRGTGLGLALVRQTIRAQGGDVSARNREGGGAEFIVHLSTASAP
ncbi:MAG: HAMP domain-containing histidine kinase [Gemmatimonadetes bacterium]|nr:HAMP domain-containing histidine kinase [Gemmatimonadota bacterium]